MTKQQFLDRVETFIRDHGWTATRFGKEATKDPTFVFTLRAGRSPGLDMVQRVMSFMERAQ